MIAFTALLINLGVTAAVVGALMLTTFAVGVRLGRHSVVDVA
jgi:steroid 5-alpha reductase family enzyme